MYRGAPGYGTPRSRPYDTLARLLLRCEAPPAAALADSLLPRPPPPVADARTWRQQPHDSDCLGSGAPSGLGRLDAQVSDDVGILGALYPVQLVHLPQKRRKESWQGMRG